MEGITETKAFEFSVRIVNLYKYLIETKREFVLSKQILRSGTAIGALLAEAKHGQSKPDFLSKINIALKEANETLYWLRLLNRTDYINAEEFDSLFKSVNELIKLLAASVKTTKGNLGRN
ncbi:MAG: four helix bundle protein [Bacteroidota bacterium]